MRYRAILFATTALLFGGVALAQGPANQQPGAGAGPTGGAGVIPGAEPGATAGPAAPGAQPTTGQQSLVPTQSEQDPKRAPGSEGEKGVDSTAGENSGTTTTYAAPKEAAPAPWPCAQRKVPSISAGTIWSGPDPATGKDWDEDTELAQLAQKIASRRTPLTEVDGLVADFAKGAGADKDKKLTKLFVGVLDIINESRNQILNGIQRYAQGQQRLAERMREESDKISQMQDEATATVGVAVDQKNKDFAWDQRIFQERKQALTYVCETPSILERRAFEIGKRIQAQL